MSYTVLARKYRPQTFTDLVGQEHVTRTLANAITTGRVAHAFLFTGVRGVGKTTSARILAKALNCERGPTPDPCNACDICRQITAGVDLDVLEIDGASNNGVDDVRRLQESLPYRPARDRHKIVIVDEVHMLSGGAFNAFLKTLEEPPAHVKFIFATTEAHKVPVTIRSRCQRYDFRLIPQSVIAERVASILAAENIEADALALAIVAREAAGSMRDALTLLDQVVAFSGEKLLGNEVAQKLGIAGRDQLFRIAEAVLKGDAKDALEVIDAIASQGLDFSHFCRQWLELTRDMIVLRVAADRPELVELTEDERARALGIGRAHELLELERVFAGLAKLIDELAGASAPRILLEMGAVRLATRPPLQDLATLIARLTQLEAGGGGSPSGPQGRPPARPSPARTGGAEARAPQLEGRTAREADLEGGAAREQARGAAREQGGHRELTREQEEVRGGHRDPDRRAFTREAAPGLPSRSERNASAPGPRALSPVGEPSKPNPFSRFVPPEDSAAPAAPAIAEPASNAEGMRAPANLPQAIAARAPNVRELPPALAGAEAHTSSSASARELVPASITAIASARPFAAQATALAQPEPSASASTELSPPARSVADAASKRAAPPELWRAIVDELRAHDPRWSAMFEHGVPHELSRERVMLVFPEGSFFGRQAESAGGLAALRRALQKVLQGEPEVQVRFAAELRGMSIAQHEAAQLDERKEAIKRKALNHPRVLEAVKVFPELAQKQDIQVD